MYMLVWGRSGFGLWCWMFHEQFVWYIRFVLMPQFIFAAPGWHHIWCITVKYVSFLSFVGFLYVTQVLPVIFPPFSWLHYVICTAVFHRRNIDSLLIYNDNNTWLWLSDTSRSYLWKTTRKLFHASKGHIDNTQSLKSELRRKSVS